jgi:4-aminobutyrate aminotransferase / (S)-3-amino-2-methylpropionate transaminase / 5-aminovalerate transaminase
MPKEFPLTPLRIPSVKTKFRHVRGVLPNRQTIAEIKKLRKAEPISMRGQPPLIWDTARGFNVFDAYGNKWLDFSSGVLITNAGHGHPAIVNAVIKQAKKLLTTYCFPNEPRIGLTQKILSIAPKGLNKVFLLSTGSETLECAIKLMRTYGRRHHGDAKSVIVSFERGFHGRTLGSQQIGGIPAGKAWIKNLDPEMIQVPFPDGFRTEDTSFKLFEKTLKAKGVKPSQVAGVIVETYQGGGTSFLPKPYARELRAWCNRNKALLCFDEVQAGFGRCGTMFGFQLYGVTPDLFCCGKGISSSLPISAVVGREAVMDLYGPNEMTSTHSGNPVCSAAALANIEVILKEKLVQNSARVGAVLQKELDKIKKEFPQVIGARHGNGLVAGLHMVKPGTKEPDGDLAWDIVYTCFKRGLLMFSPVGFGGATVKIAPPLCITKEAVIEGCRVIRDAIAEHVKG